MQEKLQASTAHFDPRQWYSTTGPNIVADYDNYIDAAFGSSSEDKAYLFIKDKYVLLDYAPSTTDAKVLKGLLRIC